MLLLNEGDKVCFESALRDAGAKAIKINEKLHHTPLGVGRPGILRATKILLALVFNMSERMKPSAID